MQLWAVYIVAADEIQTHAARDESHGQAERVVSVLPASKQADVDLSPRVSLRQFRKRSSPGCAGVSARDRSATHRINLP